MVCGTNGVVNQSSEAAPKPSRSPRKWTRIKRRLLNFRLTEKHQAVFSEDGDEPGTSVLRAKMLDAIGLRVCREQRMVDDEETGEPIIRHELVGLLLSDGAWQVADDIDNHVGTIRIGQQLRTVFGDINGQEAEEVAR